MIYKKPRYNIYYSISKNRVFKCYIDVLKKGYLYKKTKSL